MNKVRRGVIERLSVGRVFGWLNIKSVVVTLNEGLEINVGPGGIGNLGGQEIGGLQTREESIRLEIYDDEGIDVLSPTELVRRN